MPRLRFGLCLRLVRRNFYTILINVLFFFYSRRRHTRWQRDWSSDVCSSDLRSLEQLKAMVEIIETRQAGIELAIEASKQVEQSIADGIFLDGAEKVDKFETDLKEFKEVVLTKITQAEEGKAKLTDVLKGIDEQALQINQTISDLLVFIDNDLMPTYNEEMSTARNAIHTADEDR